MKEPAYDKPPIDRVEVESNGETVKLILQHRLDCGPVSFPSVCWRSTKGNSPNRRLYNMSGPWQIYPTVALGLLRDAEDRGWFSGDYDDAFSRFDVAPPTTPEVIQSDGLAQRRRDAFWEEIVVGNDPWRRDCHFIVATQPGGLWRKALIMDKQQKWLTIASVTTDPDEQQESTRARTWWRHNSMPDISAQTASRFLAYLEDALAD